MRRSAAHTVLVLVLCSAAWGAENPVAVSPGSATGTLIGDACPTFSWGEVDGAKSYELVVYRIGEESEEAKPVLRETFAGSVSGWTPSLDRCLERGGQYAWSVRAVGEKAALSWSAPSLFEVAPGPSEVEFEEAVAVVRSYFEAGAGAMSTSGTDKTQVGPESGSETEASSPTPAAVGTTQLSVDGGVEATSFTGDGSTLTNLNASNLSTGAPGSPALAKLVLCLDGNVGGWRYWDLADGTVLDCNTGKIWLKDASCLGAGTWGTSGTEGTVQKKVADLNSGTEFSCSGYTAGTYTDWQVPTISDLCSAGNFVQTCPAGNASDSLIDSSVSGQPKVVNAKGDAGWTTNGDAFVGVQSSSYWSATEFDAVNAWRVNLFDGNVGNGFKGFNFFVWPVRVIAGGLPPG